MSLVQIKAELERLPDRDQVAAFLVQLRHRDDAAHREELTRLIDDKDKSNWIKLEHLEARLDELDQAS